MTAAFEDSDRRCPRCSKRLVVERGQHETSGQPSQVHSCLSCDYLEDEGTHFRAMTMRERRERIAAMRRDLYGPREPRVIPLVYDTQDAS